MNDGTSVTAPAYIETSIPDRLEENVGILDLSGKYHTFSQRNFDVYHSPTNTMIYLSYNMSKPLFTK